MADPQGRWPPVYDAHELQDTITRLVDRGLSGFFSQERIDPPLCQGDILDLGARLPFLDDHLQPRAVLAPTRYWMLLGNTCDLAREPADVPWSQIVPVELVGEWSSLPQTTREALRRYRYARRFYVPPWDASVEGQCCIADFVRPVTVSRAALAGTQVVGRLSWEGWLLLHSCIVRFVARDDGRHSHE
jgi:hypothetical protein